MEGWVSLVGWSIADILPTKWLHFNHRSIWVTWLGYCDEQVHQFWISNIFAILKYIVINKNSCPGHIAKQPLTTHTQYYTVSQKNWHLFRRSGKVCQSKTDVLTTEPHRQPNVVQAVTLKQQKLNVINYKHETHGFVHLNLPTACFKCIS